MAKKKKVRSLGESERLTYEIKYHKICMYLLVALDKSHGPFLGGYEASCGEGAGGVQGRQWGGKGGGYSSPGEPSGKNSTGIFGSH